MALSAPISTFEASMISPPQKYPFPLLKSVLNRSEPNLVLHFNHMFSWEQINDLDRTSLQHEYSFPHMVGRVRVVKLLVLKLSALSIITILIHKMARNGGSVCRLLDH